MIKQLFSNIGFIFWSLLIAIFLLFLGEVGAQLYYSTYKPRTGYIIDTELFYYSPTLVHTIRPNSVYRLNDKGNILARYFSDNEGCARNDGVIAQFNSDGFRNTEFSSIGDKLDNEYRIVIVGGSASISWNTGEACTLDAQLKALLTKKYPNKKITIINIGNGAWKSFQELISVQRFGIKFSPDLVIAFDGFNDMEHSASMDIYQAYAEGHMKQAFQDYYNKFHHPIKYLLNALALPRFLRDLFEGANIEETKSAPVEESEWGENGKRIDIDSPKILTNPGIGNVSTKVSSYPLDLNSIEKRKDFSPYAEYVVDAYTENLTMMAKSLEIIGSKLLVFIQPNLYFRKTPTKIERRMFWKSYAKNANFVAYTHIKSLEKLNKIAKRLSNMYVVDGNDYTKYSKKLVFIDYCHMHKYGYSLNANAIIKVMDEMDLIKN